MMTPEFRSSAARLILNLIKTGDEIRRELDAEAVEFLDRIEELGMAGEGQLARSIGAVRYAPEEERLDLLQSMWDFAADDEEIVEDADLFILSAAEALDLPISTIEIVRPADFAGLAALRTQTAQSAATN